MIEGKRVRTGCMTCRRRRRKCDEKKPNCENCEIKGFSCTYGTKLNFVAQPISRRQQPEARPQANRLYTQITFVDDVTTSAAAESNDNFSSQHGQADDNPTNEHITQDIPMSQASNTRHDLIMMANPNDATRSLHATSPQYQHVTGQPIVFSPSMSEGGGMSIGIELESSRTESVHGISPLSGQPIDTCARAISIQETELLRHFRYYLAPWLDVGNSESFFEIKIMLLGSSNRSLLAALLALSACQRSLTHLEHHRDDHESSRRYRSEAEYRLPFENDSIGRVGRVVLMLADFWCSKPQDWRQLLSHQTSVLNNSFSSRPLIEELDQPVFWLLLRIDLAAAIVAAQLPLTPNLSVLLENHMLPKSFQFPLLQKQNAIQAHQQSLFLLARCLCLIYGSHDDSSTIQKHGTPSTPLSSGTSSLSASWMLIWNDNQEWYLNRPMHMQQILDFRGIEADQINSQSPSSFPILIYSTTLALLSNAVYHISSLLLLIKRPWLLKELPGSRQSKSRNWHAQSIAGIVTSNETLDQWDPILIAGVLLVAKEMTHETQQISMLECLKRVTRMTGIKLDHETAALKAEWSISRYVEEAVYQYD